MNEHQKMKIKFRKRENQSQAEGSSEKEQRQERQREKKAKWRKDREIGKNMEGPKRIEMTFCMGFSSWETPEKAESVRRIFLLRKVFCDMRCV